MLKRILCIILVAIILGIALYFIPWRTEIRIHTTGAEVDSQGNILTEGEFVLEGWHCNYLFQQDTFEITSLELPNIGQPNFQIRGQQIMITDGKNIPSGTVFYSIYAFFYDPDTNGAESAKICFPLDFQYALFRLGDNSPGSRIFVTTGSDDPSPVEMLKEFYLLLTD